MKLGYTYLPRWVTDRAIYSYLAILLVTAFLFYSFTMRWYLILFGVVEVFSFFYFSNVLTKEWSTEHLRNATFEKQLFGTSLAIRLVYVLFSYWFYVTITGIPFEPNAADSYFYHKCALQGAQILRSRSIWSFWHDFKAFMCMDISDTGYAAYLSIVYFLTNDSILVGRFIKACLSALTVLFIYKLTVRNFGEHTGRMAGVLCMMMPNLIFYCGVHLKEVEMVFITVCFVNMADSMLRNRNFSAWNLVPIFLLGLALFTIRTALAIVTILALLFSIVVASNAVINWAKKIIIGVLAAVLIGLTIGNRIYENSKQMIEIVQNDGLKKGMEYRAKRDNGNKFAEYAGAAVFAPLIFTLPFPTMVNIPEQENQQFINGGNYVKNILSAFIILAILSLLLSGEWRRCAMPLAFMLGYLMVLVFSNYAHSERFHQPVLPFELMFVAYAIPLLGKKHKRWYNYWLVIMFVAAIAWQWFKLAGRNMV